MPDVLVPRRHRPVEGIHIRSCRHLHPLDATKYHGIPVTTVARTLVDLTDVLTAEELANVIHEAAYPQPLQPRRPRAERCERANGRHNLDRLEEAIAAHLAGSAGTKSGKEPPSRSLLKDAASRSRS